jgi:hypothetical protein
LNTKRRISLRGNFV